MEERKNTKNEQNTNEQNTQNTNKNAKNTKNTKNCKEPGTQAESRGKRRGSYFALNGSHPDTPPA